MVCNITLKSFVGLCTMLHFHYYDMLLLTSLLLWSCLVYYIYVFHEVIFPFYSILHILDYVYLSSFWWSQKGGEGYVFVCWKFQDMKKSWIAKERGRYILSWLDQIFKRFCHHQKGGDCRSVFRLDTVAGLFWWLQSPMAKRRKELKMIKLKQDQVKIVIA